MNMPSFFKPRLSAISLFVRVLILLFTTVLAAQAVTFALILLMPTPSTPITSVTSIVDALRTGRTSNIRLRVGYGTKPADNWTDPSELAVARQIASDLHVPVQRVEVISLRALGSGPPVHPDDVHPQSVIRPIPADSELDIGTLRANNNVAKTQSMSGRFVVGLRIGDRRWRLVTLQGVLIATWQREVLLWLTGSMAVVAPFAWLFARRISAPIASFGVAVRELGRNPSGVPMQIEGPPEIAAAAAAVNDMQRQISRYVEDRTMMVGAIAHDLRTPLMRLSLRLQKAPDDVRRDSEGDIREIEAMATAALAFVRDLSVRDGRHRLALRALVETVADEFADKGEDVVFEPGIDAIVFADLNGIKRMLTNIVENAVAYAGNARIALRLHGDVAMIEVVDTGPGIPIVELERVFDPFYRVEQSRSRHTGGTGLGLASARAVARAHGGNIALSNRPGGGLLAAISLPL